MIKPTMKPGIFQGRCYEGSGLLAILLVCFVAGAPMSANAAVFVFANGQDISQRTGGGKVISAFPDVALTPPSPPAGPIPIPYPVIGSSDTDQGSKTTKVTTKVVIKAGAYQRSSGDEPGLVADTISTDVLGFLGDTIELSWNTDIHSAETASLSLLLADPETGLALGPEYAVEVTDSQSGSISFDIANAPLTIFDLVLLAIQTTDEGQQPQSVLALTDIKIDGVSVAEQFRVSEIPLPPALLLFASGLLGLLFSHAGRQQGLT